MGTCDNCQEPLEEGWKICPYCGESASSRREENTRSRRQRDSREPSTSPLDTNRRESERGLESTTLSSGEQHIPSSQNESDASRSAQRKTDGPSTSQGGSRNRTGEDETDYSFSPPESPKNSNDSQEDSTTRSSREPGADEAYCSSCGEIIKAAAEICPHCGVEQLDDTQSDIPQSREYELQQIARQSTGTIGLVGFLFPPAAYFLINKMGLAIACLLTANFLFLGHLITPFHARGIVKSARQQLEQAGSNW